MGPLCRRYYITVLPRSCLPLGLCFLFIVKNWGSIFLCLYHRHRSSRAKDCEMETLNLWSKINKSLFHEIRVRCPVTVINVTNTHPHTSYPYFLFLFPILNSRPTQKLHIDGKLFAFLTSYSGTTHHRESKMKD